MTDQTILEVIEVVRPKGKRDRIVPVKILKGSPKINMQLKSPDMAGQWQIVGVGTMPADYAWAHPNEIVLVMINLEDGKEVVAGIKLVDED